MPLSLSACVLCLIIFLQGIQGGSVYWFDNAECQGIKSGMSEVFPSNGCQRAYDYTNGTNYNYFRFTFQCSEDNLVLFSFFYDDDNDCLNITASGAGKGDGKTCIPLYFIATDQIAEYEQISCASDVSENNNSQHSAVVGLSVAFALACLALLALLIWWLCAFVRRTTIEDRQWLSAMMN
jgi:hypothetical protein